MSEVMKLVWLLGGYGLWIAIVTGAAVLFSLWKVLEVAL